jgi:hypothetical protein
MNSDQIVERLRSVDSPDIRGVAERVSELLLHKEAADEIERQKTKIEQLTQGLVVTTVNENRKLQGKVERLRELLKECQIYVEGMSSVDSELCDRVEKELSDE